MSVRLRGGGRWPLLVRHLMLAQLVLIGIVWTALMVFVIVDSRSDTDILQSSDVYDAVARVAENLARAPQQQHESLRAIELALREQPADFRTPDQLGTHMQVWQGGRLVYRTLGPLPPIADNGGDGIETITIAGQEWRMRTRRSARSDTRVAILLPSVPWNFFVKISARQYYFVPLLISLPFLLLPPWLSIRLALRSWNRVSREVAQRGPHDLSPLNLQSSHMELAAMVNSINLLMLRVDQSAQRERDFIADAAHELRTPLAAMRVNVEALQAQAHDRSQSELLAGIVNSNDRAARLVGQLLSLMRSDATEGGGGERVALDGLLQDRLAVLSRLAAGAGVELELLAEPGVAIHGDAEQLVSLIDNLVENAIKYSPPGGLVTVRLEGDAGGAVLSVADQGPGIAPALRQRVFDRFFRAPQQSQGGSGLGLAIVQSAVQRHGGAIALDDSAGGGLLVRVRLPAQRPSAL